MLMILLCNSTVSIVAFLILFAVVMSTAGVFIGLMVTAQPFGIVMSGVGVIVLSRNCSWTQHHTYRYF